MIEADFPNGRLEAGEAELLFRQRIMRSPRRAKCVQCGTINDPNARANRVELPIWWHEPGLSVVANANVQLRARQ